MRCYRARTLALSFEVKYLALLFFPMPSSTHLVGSEKMHMLSPPPYWTPPTTGPRLEALKTIFSEEFRSVFLWAQNFLCIAR